MPCCLWFGAKASLWVHRVRAPAGGGDLRLYAAVVFIRVLGDPEKRSERTIWDVQANTQNLRP